MHLMVPGLLTQDPGSKTVQVMDQRLFADVCTTAVVLQNGSESETEGRNGLGP